MVLSAFILNIISDNTKNVKNNFLKIGLDKYYNIVYNYNQDSSKILIRKEARK